MDPSDLKGSLFMSGILISKEVITCSLKCSRSHPSAVRFMISIFNVKKWLATGT